VRPIWCNVSIFARLNQKSIENEEVVFLDCNHRSDDVGL
jgi:hypothetical protein